MANILLKFVHVFIFGPIFFKFEYNVAHIIVLMALENEQV